MSYTLIAFVWAIRGRQWPEATATTGHELLGPVPSALHFVAIQAKLDVSHCFSALAINCLYGSNKMQRLEEPEEKYG